MMVSPTIQWMEAAAAAVKPMMEWNGLADLFYLKKMVT